MSLQQICAEALALQQQGRDAEAEPLYRRVLAAEPGHFTANYMLGLIRRQQGRREEALALIGAALAANPFLPEALSDYGAALSDLGRFDAALASYDKALAIDPASLPALYNRCAALMGLGRFEEAVAGYDRLQLLHPGSVEIRNARGSALLNLGRLEAARADFEAALAIQPFFAAALFNRGNVLQALKDFSQALASYDQVMALEPGFAQGWNGRGTALHALGRFEEALASYDKALALAPGLGEAAYNRGLTLSELARHEEALVSYEKAIAQGNHINAARRNQAFCHLLQGRFDPGWQLYEWRRWRDEVPVFRSYAQPLWLGQEDISGKTLFVHWEQGYGDTIQFCRYVPLCKARGANVVLSVQPPLQALLRQLGVPVIGPQEVPGAFDFHVPLLSLPLAFATSLASIPPLHLAADDKLVRAWAARLPPKTTPRIGFSWKGAASHTGDRRRSMALEQFLPLFGAGAQAIALQKDADAAERAVLEKNGIGFYGAAQADFADTAALMAHLDLVITVDTAMAHLAGALGKPVWILLPHNPDFRWLLGRDDSPWYPSARLFRQPQSGDWASVLERVKSVLERVKQELVVR